MMVYVLVLLIMLISFARIENVNETMKLKIVLFMLFGLASLRAYTVGNDTLNYYNLFNQIANNKSVIPLLTDRFEIGYLYLNYFIALLSKNFRVFLIIVNGFIYYSYYKFIKNNSAHMIYSALLFLLVGLFAQTLSVMRLEVAIAFTLNSYDAKRNNQKILSVIFALSAILFHRIAIVYLITFFIPHKLSKNYIIITLTVGGMFSIFFSKILNLVINFIPYYGSYLEGDTYLVGEVKLATIAMILMNASVVLYCWRLKRINGYPQLIGNDLIDWQFNMCYTSLLCFMVSLNFNLLDRLAYFFWPYMIVLIPNMISTYKKRKNVIITRVVIALLFLAYFFVCNLYKNEWNGIFPYVFGTFKE